jgi:tRNA-splicing endonuclease subunit Sen2
MGKIQVEGSTPSPGENSKKKTRWIAQQCREQRCEPCSREELNKEEHDRTRETVVSNYWGVMLGFTLLSSLLVYKLRSLL